MKVSDFFRVAALFSSVLLLGGCVSPFLVHPQFGLAQPTINRSEPLGYDLNINVISNLPARYEVEFSEGFGSQPYDIVGQVQEMFEDYATYVSDVGGRESLNIRIIINDLSPMEEKIGGSFITPAQVFYGASISYDVALADEAGKVLAERSFKISDKAEYESGSWMAAASAGVNATVNKMIIVTHNYIERTVADL